VGESAENLSAVDPVLGEVDYLVSARRRWCSLTISTRSKSSRRRVPMILSQIAFALGACGGLARILMLSAVNTASKELVNWPARSLIRNLL
jgi:hypothetical protein